MWSDLAESYYHSAQDDLQSKTDEAAALSSKVNRLEQALRQIM